MQEQEGRKEKGMENLVTQKLSKHHPNSPLGSLDLKPNLCQLRQHSRETRQTAELGKKGEKKNASFRKLSWICKLATFISYPFLLPSP